MHQATHHTLLLNSRLHPPRRGRGVLPRPRLENLAPLLLDHCLSVLKAPPGFGKTTLASAWVEALGARGVRHAWLTLEESENSSTHLLYCLIAALQQSCPEQAPDSQRLRQEMPYASPAMLATLLLNAIGSRPEPLLLVLDDCHRFSEENLCDALQLLLRHPPEQLHVLLISRQQISSKLLQQVRGEPILELDAQSLCFQNEETRALLNRAGLTCDNQQLEQLQQATGGWSTALRAYLLGAQKNRHVTLPRNLNRLFDELLENCEPGFSERLLPLGLLESFSAELLEHCLGDGQQLIDQLEQGQFFLNLPGGNSPWYSLHPLFREYLAQRYAQSHAPQILKSLQLKAAHWLAAQGHLSAAINLSLNAGEQSLAESWINHCAMDLVEQGDFLCLLQWERQLREKLPGLPPSLRLALGWGAALAMQQEKASELLHSLKNTTIGEQWEWRALHAMLLAMAGQGVLAADHAGECLPHLSSRPWIYNVLLNVQRYGYMQSANWAAYYQLPPLLSQPLSRSRYLFNRLYQNCIDALVDLHQGRLAHAESRLLQALDETQKSHADNPILAALPKAFLAQIRLLQGRDAEAGELLDGCLQYVQRAGFSEWIMAVMGSQVRLLRQQQQLPAARQCLAELENLAQRHRCPRLQANVLVERSLLAQQEQQPQQLANIAQRLAELSNAQPSPSSEIESAWLTVSLSRHDLDESAFEDLHARSQALLQQLLNEQRHLLHAQLQLTIAQALQQRGNSAAPILMQKARQLLEVQGVLSVTREQYPVISRQVLAEPASSQNYNLTIKERLILQELTNGQPNKGIAKALGVAPETIKTHLKNIFAKLGVNNRAQAIRVFQTICAKENEA